MRKNTVFLRETLGAAILHVRSGRATSRTTLAKALGISPSTVGLYVDRLIADKLLDESGVNQGRMGRPQRLLTALPGAGWFAGVEFNAQRLQAAAVDFSGAQIGSVSRPLPKNVTAETVVQTIVSSVGQLAETISAPLLAVGLGLPGLVNPEEGIGIRFTFIPDWIDVPVSQKLTELLKVPVILQNNLRAIALAERWFGMAQNLSDYIVLGPRSGFGIAMVQQGRLINGANHAAGEVGCWPWPLDSGPGGVEMHHALSAPTTWRRLAGVPPDAELPEDLRAALAPYAEAGGAEWDQVCVDFARVIACIQLMADVEVLILHGPLTALGERFCAGITAAAKKLAPSLQLCGLKVVPSQLGDDAGALGAASLAMESWAPE